MQTQNQQNYLRPSQTDRVATHLETALDELRAALHSARSHLREIASRVVPPSPNAQGTGGPAAVPTTYAHHVAEANETAQEILALAADLNGRI